MGKVFAIKKDRCRSSAIKMQPDPRSVRCAMMIALRCCDSRTDLILSGQKQASLTRSFGGHPFFLNHSFAKASRQGY